MADELRSDQQANDAPSQRQSASVSRSVPMSVVASRIVWYITGVIVVLLALRLVLLLLGAQQGNGFVDFVYSLSGVFAAPFFGIFNDTAIYGSSHFEPSSLVAVAAYLLVGWGLAKLFTISSSHPAA
ncbi:MAG: hypothetical protein WAT17_03520 [Candidatus Saccharimonadales bacterium]|jgi:succinate dehydrogenase hydrophobic anchor subunit